jgi:hypothetical protein
MGESGGRRAARKLRDKQETMHYLAKSEMSPTQGAHGGAVEVMAEAWLLYM